MSFAETPGLAVIRPATSGDAAEVVGLLAELGYPDNDVGSVRRRLDDWGQEANSAVLVAERGGELLGLVAVTTIRYLERDGRLGRIVALVVSASSRGQGVGRLLVGTAGRIAWQYGCVAMEISSARARTAAHAFYRELGYVDKCEASARFIRSLLPG